ncbi:MAG: hypothetical protein ACUZ8E_03115 [Candidatus Anammoxibacter sp.]
MKTIKIKMGAFEGTNEWMMKEYGSWEDHDCTEDHVCFILDREIGKGKNYMELTVKEAETLLKSVSYHCVAGWDSDDRVRYWKITWEAYKNKLEKAIN